MPLAPPRRAAPADPPADGFAERAEAFNQAFDDFMRTARPEVGINLFSDIGKALIVAPLLAGGFAVHRLVRRRGIPTRAIAELAIVASLIAGAAILIRITVAADSGTPLAPIARALGADAGIDVTLAPGGQITIVALAAMLLGGLLTLDIGRRGTPGDPFGRQDR